MRSKPEIPATPCHRVVASNGALAGYRAGQEIITKRKILVDEGVVFKGKKVDLAVSQWKT